MVKQRKYFDYNKGNESNMDVEVNENEPKSNNKKTDYESLLSEESDDETNAQAKKLLIIIPKKKKKILYLRLPNPKASDDLDDNYESFANNLNY